MAQTIETFPNGTNQWGPNDDVRMEQFTEDNRIIYEELLKRSTLSGVWDIAIRGQTTAGSPIYMRPNTVAVWEINGNEITLYFSVYLSNLGGMSGNLQIYNIPKIPAVRSTCTALFSGYNSGLLPVCLHISPDATYIDLRAIGATNYLAINASNITNDFSVIGAALRYKFRGA